MNGEIMWKINLGPNELKHFDTAARPGYNYLD